MRPQLPGADNRTTPTPRPSAAGSRRTQRARARGRCCWPPRVSLRCRLTRWGWKGELRVGVHAVHPQGCVTLLSLCVYATCGLAHGSMPDGREHTGPSEAGQLEAGQPGQPCLSHATAGQSRQSWSSVLSALHSLTAATAPHYRGRPGGWRRGERASRAQLGQAVAQLGSASAGNTASPIIGHMRPPHCRHCKITTDTVTIKCPAGRARAGALHRPAHRGAGGR